MICVGMDVFHTHNILYLGFKKKRIHDMINKITYFTERGR